MTESSFDLWRARLAWILGPLAAVALWLLPLDLDPRAHKLAAIVALAVIFWFGECLPMAVTALGAAVLCILCGVAPQKEVFAQFGHPVVFLFLGGFLIARAMSLHGLDRRLALAVLSRPQVARSPGAVLAAFGAATAFLSMWMSNTAITALMLPIALGAAGGMKNGEDFARRLVLMVAFSASIGGLGTPVGSPTNLVALSQLEKLSGSRPDFAEWMRYGIPLACMMWLALFLVLRPRGTAGTAHSFLHFAEEWKAMPQMSRAEKNTALVFLLAVVLWIGPAFFPGMPAPPEETTALLCALLLFLLPGAPGKKVLIWDDAARVDWGTILLFGGGLVLGQQIFDTGLAKSVGAVIHSALGQPGPGVLLAAAIVTAIVFSEATSNVASANVVVPMMIAVAQAAHCDPRPIAIGACLACSFGFCLPISTPPNALAYATGRVPLKDMIRTGILLDITGGIVIWLTIWFLTPSAK